jgi:DNA-directed RNA polymerase subunit N (RpoN/RPB10)
MIIPIRCISCGKPVGQLWEKYQDKIKSGETKKESMDELGLERFCCRALFLGHIDLLDNVSVFKKD